MTYEEIKKEIRKAMEDVKYKADIILGLDISLEIVERLQMLEEKRNE